VLPAFCGRSSDPLHEVRQSVDELRRSLAEVVAGISATQSLMKSQQRQLDDIVRSSGLQRVGLFSINSRLMQ